MCSNDLTATTQNIYLSCGHIMFHKIQQINFSGLYRKQGFTSSRSGVAQATKPAILMGLRRAAAIKLVRGGNSFYQNTEIVLHHSPELPVQQTTGSSDTLLTTELHYLCKTRSRLGKSFHVPMAKR